MGSEKKNKDTGVGSTPSPNPSTPCEKSPCEKCGKGPQVWVERETGERVCAECFEPVFVDQYAPIGTTRLTLMCTVYLNFELTGGPLDAHNQRIIESAKAEITGRHGHFQSILDGEQIGSSEHELYPGQISFDWDPMWEEAEAEAESCCICGYPNDRIGEGASTCTDCARQEGQ